MTDDGIVGMQDVPKPSDCAPCCLWNIFVPQVIQISTGCTRTCDLCEISHCMCDVLFFIGSFHLVWQMVATTSSLQDRGSMPVLLNQRGRGVHSTASITVGDIWRDRGLLVLTTRARVWISSMQSSNSSFTQCRADDANDVQVLPPDLLSASSV